MLDETVRTLSRQARIPGFRPGKVPRQVLEARMGGPTALRAEALREALPDFYAQAVADAEVEPIAPPEIDITSGEEAGALAFDALVEVRPTSPSRLRRAAGDRPVLAVTDEEVDAQWTGCASTDAELVEVGRPAVDGDNVTIDLHGNGPTGPRSSTSRTTSTRWAAAGWSPELDDQLRGAKVGDILAFTADARPSAERAVAFRVLVKDVKEKKLPEVTDEWAAEARSSPRSAELRDDLRRGIGRVKVVQAQLALREQHAGRAGRAGRRRRGARGAGRRGGAPAGPRPRATASRQQRITRRAVPGGHRAAPGTNWWPRSGTRPLRAVKADLALRALADAEDLDVADEELDAELDAMAERMGIDPAELRAPPRPRRQDRRGTLGAAEGQGADVAAGPRGAGRRGGQPVSRTT